jgi:hypothetical protein
MTRPIPVAFRWIDVDVLGAHGTVETRPAMVPLERFRKACDRQYGKPGGVFILSPDEHASERSRRHYFACLNEAWKNLPESIQHRYPSMQHLRKTALVKAGFRKERHQVCATYAEALEVAALVKDVDEFCVTVVHPGRDVAGPATLSVYTAESQSTFAMKADRFQASKEAVLGLVAGLIGSTVEDLKRHSRPEEEADERRNPDPGLGDEGADRKALEAPRPGPSGGGGAVSQRALAARAAPQGPKNGSRG